MRAPQLLASPSELPLGSHGVSFHSTDGEAAQHAASFLAGTPRGQRARFWVKDSATAAFYAQAAGQHAPAHVGCVAVLPTEQVHEVDGRLRPVPLVEEFLVAHPEGVTAGGGTITAYWAPPNIPDHLEYEDWFERQPRSKSRFICPYDLRAVPPDLAPEVMRQLGAHHSHVILSDCTEEAAQLLELFIFPSSHELPESLDRTYRWAVEKGHVSVDANTGAFRLAPSGEEIIRAWGERGTANW